MSVSEKIQRIGKEFDPKTVELALAIHLAENFNNERCNSGGCRYGIGALQIVQSTFAENCEGDVFNEENNIKCGLDMISQRQLWRWKQSAYDMKNHTGWLNRLSEETRDYALEIFKEKEMLKCSCISYMRELGHDFPRVPDPSYLEANSPPFLGGLILLDLDYPHIGEIVEFRAGILIYKERLLINGKCLTRLNWIEYNDERVRGYMK